MQAIPHERIDVSSPFEWPWQTHLGLAIIVGASGGGGGGGGACHRDREGSNILGGGGGKGGKGGGGSILIRRQKSNQYFASGGNGGGGGHGGGFFDHRGPVDGQNGVGCPFGSGGEGGKGKEVQGDLANLLAKGGDGGRGFPGEIRFVELTDLSEGEVFGIVVGKGGAGGAKADGKQPGEDGGKGADGYVLFVPLFKDNGALR